MRESDRLDPPLFSPATKAESGHDENITVGRVIETLGADVARELERLSRLVYGRGRTIAAERGIIIADTKFEFGRDRAGHITLIDEVLVLPTSSRFWPADQYQPGRSQPSFDKQPLRALPRWRASRRSLERRRAPATSSGDGCRRHERAISRRVPPNHRRRARSHGATVNFAPEGLGFIGVSTLIAVAMYGVALNRRSWPLWLLAFALTLVALWVAYFFSDPERLGERGDRLVISPADGKVVMITDVDEPTFMKGRVVRVSVFMNVFDVHVNRYPISGVIRFVERKAGRFLNAASEESSLQNEQVSVGLETSNGAGRATQILVRQIAGLIARRIITDGKDGDRVRQGDRMGLIRFGSRVDVFLPAGSTVRVKVGDVAQAGVTVLAELASQ